MNYPGVVARGELFSVPTKDGITLPSMTNSIFLYDTKEEEIHALNSSYTNDYWPAWDPDGRYLYFCSDRQINPLIDELDFNVIEMKNDKLYAVLLREDVDNPLRDLAGLPPDPEDDDDDEEEGDDADEAEEDNDEEAIGWEGASRPPSPTPPHIRFRIRRFPTSIHSMTSMPAVL